jgi:O-antigen/teichoic acid export membrane protein
MLFAVTQVLTFNLDYLVIGHQSASSQLGLYAVAFMIAFAPLQHFSGEVGRVLFAAAAASGESGSAARTIVATRLMTLLLLPTVPLAIALAPLVLPALLGSRWSGMVVPFELLVVAGVGYSIVNCIGEALSGSGQMPFRAKFNVLWSLVTLAVMIVLVHFDGIRGAALAHVLVFAGYAAVFMTTGMRRIGSNARALWQALLPVIWAVAVQAAVGFSLEAGLRGAGVPRWPSALTGAAGGLVCLVLLATRGEQAPLREAMSFARGAWKRPRRGVAHRLEESGIGQ